MIELAKKTAIISAPLDTVFQYVTNMDNYGCWFPGVQAIKSKNSFPHATIGKTYLETLLLPDDEYELTIEVVQCKANQFFLTKGDLEGVLPQMTIEFYADGESNCRMELQYHSRNLSLTAESDIVISLREDLAVRASVGVANLQQILGGNRVIYSF